MLSSRKGLIITAVFTIIVGIAGYLSGIFPQPTTPNTPLPQNAVRADDATLAVWNDFLRVRAKIQRKEALLGIQKDRDELFGIYNRMQQMVPKGQAWDERGYIVPPSEPTAPPK